MTNPVTVPIEHLDVRAYTVPTDFPESDGTLEWDSTTIVIVEATAAGRRGLGYSYADVATARFVQEKLIDIVRGRDAMAVSAAWSAMVHAIRNLGRPGLASMAISAVDNALWDLKARLLGLPLVTLLGQVHERMPIYGSGGFTSYSMGQLEEQLGGWAAAGISRVKMKIGRRRQDDLERIRTARKSIGSETELFIDANGAYSRKQALAVAEAAAEWGVTWFEEPVSSDDLDGLRLLRDRAPAGMDITAGEYGYHLFYFRRLLEAGAVDVLQPDVTRCGGFTGFLQAALLCQSFAVPLSAHCVPSLSVHACCAVPVARHLEYFHDHVRVEQFLFDGVPSPVKGTLQPDLSRPGVGLELKRADAERYAAFP